MDSLGRADQPGAHLLVVEDHAMFASVMSRVLREHGGFQPDIVGTAEEALSRALEQHYDLILIDISLPGRDGLWLGGQLRERRPDQRFLMISGHDEIEVVEGSLAAGSRGYVLKDDVPGLLEGVRAALRGEIYISRALTQRDRPSREPRRKPVRRQQPASHRR